MANEFRVKNGLIIDEVNTNAGNVTIADGNISSDGTMSIVSTNNAANALYLHVNAGTSETIKIHADQGAGSGSIELTSDAGGIDVNAAGLISLESSADEIQIGTTIADGQVITIGKSGATEISLEPHGTAASEKISITNTAGNAADAIKIAAAAGGLTVDVAGDIVLDADGADVVFKDGGTSIGTFTNSSSDFVIQSNVQDKDIILKGNDGGSTISALTLDMSAAGNAYFYNKGIFNDTALDPTAIVQVNGDALSSGDAWTSNSGTWSANGHNYSELRLYSDIANDDINGTTYAGATNMVVLHNAENVTSSEQGIVFTVGDGGTGSTWGAGRNPDGEFQIGHRAKDFDADMGNTGAVMKSAQGLLTVDTSGNQILEADGASLGFRSNSQLTRIRGSASASASVLYSLPPADGSNTNVLTTNGSGALSWASAGGGAASSLAADDLTAGDAAVGFSTSSGAITIDSNAAGVTIDGHTGVTIQSTNSGNILLDSVAEIVLDADGGQVHIKDGGADHFLLDCDATAFTIYDDQDTGDLFSITVAQHGATTIATVDDDATAANLTLDIDGDITLDADGGNIIFADAGTTYIDFAVDGSTDTMTVTGALVVDASGDITLDADGGDVVLKDGGTQFGSLTNSSGNLIIKSGSTTMLTGSGANATVAGNLVVTGNLTINGTTTEVSSTSITVEDALLELGMVDGSAPSSTTSIDLGILVNYYASSAKKGAFFWDTSATCWALTEVASEDGAQVLTPTAGATEMRYYYDAANYFSIAVAADGATTLSTVDSDAAAGNLQITADGTAEIEGTTITLDSAGDIELNADGDDINLKAGSTSFGSFTNNSGVLQIKSATDKELEIRSERDMTFVIDDDASDSNSFFKFEAQDNTLADSTNFDARVGPVTTKYYSTSLLLGQTEFGKGVIDEGSGAEGTLFTYDGTVFGAVEVTIHLTDGTTDQINKMLICAETASGDAVNYSNYSVLYSDGSTELGTVRATISSNTVSVKVDADDNDTVTYAVTFLA